MDPNEFSKAKEGQDALSIQDIIYLCIGRWYWFVISVVLCVGLAYVYILRTQPVYTRTAAILIKEQNKGSRAADMETFADLGIFSSSTNIQNEIETLKAQDLMLEVVKRLNLDMNYQTDGRFHRVTLFGTTLPVNVAFIDVAPNETASCEINLSPDKKYTASNFRFGKDVESDKVVSGVVGDTIQTPIGLMAVLPAKDYNVESPMKLYVAKSTLSQAKTRFSKKLDVTQSNEKSSIIELTFRDVSTQRADDVLNALITAYNENWVRDKNQIAVSTSMFINDRLGVIESELGNVDNDISSYKSEHLLPDVSAAASMAMNQAKEANSAIKDLNNQVYMARYIRNYLSNNANSKTLIPVNSGLENAALNSQIAEYNEKVMERNSLLAHTSEKNPLIVEMDQNLESMRAALVSSIDNQIIALNGQIKTLQGYGGQATALIASNPKQANYLLSVERQQKVKESLYLYLLQKREENELSQAFTAYNTRVLSVPDGLPFPTSPAKARILLLAFVIGIAIPAGIIFLKETYNTVVRGRKDLESLSIPFAGEIPAANVGGKKRWYQLRSRKIGHYNESGVVVVKKQNRNIINEAFRVVRTNVEFMVGKHDEGYTIAVTSANPGSGKTFITFNLGLSLAIKEKKVLIIDLDLRKGSQSVYVGSPKIGISNYLAGQVDDIEKMIVRNVQDTSLDIIPIGVRPPNPTELLFSPRLAELMEKLRKEYDYIFLDCPPVEIVADAAIINQFADLTLFIIRAGLFDRTMLPEVEKYYTSKKYKNLAVLLNGTDGGAGKYGYRYGSRYGYRYGYKYGYSYGYGSHSHSDQSTSAE